jgi:hypothetical protein
MTLDPHIEPDTKNWTWVLERPCPECGFDASAVNVQAAGDEVRRIAAAWEEPLTRPTVRVRPTPSVWSPLEYGCHVRDVFALFDRRLELMLTEHDPQFDNWDQDRTAVEDAYGSQDPAQVLAALVEAGERLAARLDAVSGGQWSRPGRRSDGAAFSVDSFVRYLLHDPVHHLRDVS